MLDYRRIASEWHGGQWTALYAFASSGHIGSDLQTEIRRTYNRLATVQRTCRFGRELRTLHSHIGRRIVDMNYRRQHPSNIGRANHEEND